MSQAAQFAVTKDKRMVTGFAIALSSLFDKGKSLDSYLKGMDKLSGEVGAPREVDKGRDAAVQKTLSELSKLNQILS